MGNVLEFQSARLQLHLVLLRELGVPDIFAWRVLGNPRDRLWDGNLYAAPALVATRRDDTACIVELKSGSTPEELPHDRALKAALDAAVVRQCLERRGSRCSTIWSWFVFEDGGRFEIDTSPALLVALRQQAQRAMRDHGLSTTSTWELATRWETLVGRSALGS